MRNPRPVTVKTGASAALVTGICLSFMIAGYAGTTPGLFNWGPALVTALLAAIAAAVWRLVRIGALLLERVDALLEATLDAHQPTDVGPYGEVPRDVL